MRFLASLPILYNRDLVAEAIDRLMNSQSHVTGFFDAIALENLFKSLLPSNEFAHTETDLFIIATCLDCRRRGIFNGLYEFEDEENLFMTNIPIHKAVRASTCVPGMFEPVKLNGRYFIDGEIKQTLSADIGVHLADKVIISHTYQPLYLGEQGSVHDLGWLNIVRQSSSIILSERIAVWRHIYEQQYPDKEIIWIQPDPEDVVFFKAPEFSFNPDIQKKLIHSGEIAAFRAFNKMPV
jgi:predicted acylesterase/phospholipase RssA